MRCTFGCCCLLIASAAAGQERAPVQSLCGDHQNTTASSGSHGCPDRVRGCSSAFNISLIRAGKPFPPWLREEMRANHAGETGAVEIYTGALWALRVRAAVMAAVSSKQAGKNDDAVLLYDKKLMEFAKEHQEAEQHHLSLFDQILEPSERSLFPAWWLPARVIGAVSTLFYPRAMYLTTEAVETFVEEHYNFQIERLTEDHKHKQHAPSIELRRMLQANRDDEVLHKEEGQAGAAEGPLPWPTWLDAIWKRVVGLGSATAAAISKKV